MSTQTQESIQDSFIYHEMMAHPALFAHGSPQKVAIIGDSHAGILLEVLKHPSVSEIWQVEGHDSASIDARINFHSGNYAEWIAQTPPDFFDVIIVSTQPVDAPDFLQHCLNALNAEGILIQQSNSPFEVPALKSIHENLHAIGFRDVQILHFPQPSFPSGWRMAWIATQRGVFRQVSEKDIYSKPFKTRYYNLDIHKAALALPEFIREELNITA